MLKQTDEEQVPLTPAQQKAAETMVARWEAEDRRRQMADARSEAWKSNLLSNKQGPRPILANAIAALRYAPEWQDVLYYDEFSMVTMVRHAPPWEGGAIVDRKWMPKDDSLAADWLQRQDVVVPTAIAAEAVEVVARDAGVHPLRQYLEECAVNWDGNSRAAEWLAFYLGAARSPYTSAVGRAWMISAVARIMEPGAKADSMLILEGRQGIGKSRAIKTLADPWFSDELADIGSKDASLQLSGNWIFELSELGAMQKSEVTKLKAFLSCTQDRFRPPYGRRVIEVPRQCVFVGTTNDTEYLKDPTGARRFWPVRVGGNLLLRDLEADRDQLWGEAVTLFRDGCTWWLNSPRTITAAQEEQDQRYVSDPWDDAMARFLEARNDTSVAEILGEALHIEAGKRTQVDQNRVARFLAKGWLKYQHRNGDRREWRYRRADQ